MRKESIKDVIKEKSKKLSDTTKGMVEKTKSAVIKTIDQNNDNSVGLDDFNIIKNKINEKAKQTAIDVKKSIDERKLNNELKKLELIYKNNLEDENFKLPNILCLSEENQSFPKIDVCINAMGRYTRNNDFKYITFFIDKVDALDIEFYPGIFCTVYYRDPVYRNRYIAMDDYFNYMRKARISELDKVAQDLGAKHFQVLASEEKKSSHKKMRTFSLEGTDSDLKLSAGGSLKKSKKEEKISAYEIGVEDTFKGHKPIEPELHYLKNDPEIERLINARMKKNRIKRKVVRIELNKTSGIKKNDFIKVKGAYKSLNITADRKIEEEFNDEQKLIFYYIIEF